MTMSLGTRSTARWVLIDAGFPLADARALAVEEAVAPHPHGPFGEGQVVVHRADFLREQLGLVLALAAGAVVLAEQEDFVHADVEGVGAGGVREFVDQVEDDVVHLGMERAVAAAVDALVLRVLAGSLVELRVNCAGALRCSSPRIGGRAG